MLSSLSLLPSIPLTAQASIVNDMTYYMCQPDPQLHSRPLVMFILKVFKTICLFLAGHLIN